MVIRLTTVMTIMDTQPLKYCVLQKVRALLLEEIQKTFQGTPLNAEHYCLVEYRLGNMIASGVNLTAVSTGDDPVPMPIPT